MSPRLCWRSAGASASEKRRWGGVRDPVGGRGGVGPGTRKGVCGRCGSCVTVTPCGAADGNGGGGMMCARYPVLDRARYPVMDLAGRCYQGCMQLKESVVQLADAVCRADR